MERKCWWCKSYEEVKEDVAIMGGKYMCSRCYKKVKRAIGKTLGRSE